MAHSFALLVLRYLTLRGSDVKLLALSPNSRWEQDRGDSNGQYYPNDYYNCGSAEVDGNTVIEAVSIRDYLAENPDATILRTF